MLFRSRVVGRRYFGDRLLGLEQHEAGRPPFVGAAVPGLQPHLLSDTLIESMFSIVEVNQHRVDVEKLYPTVHWSRTNNV